MSPKAPHFTKGPGTTVAHLSHLCARKGLFWQTGYTQWRLGGFAPCDFFHFWQRYPLAMILPRPILKPVCVLGKLTCLEGRGCLTGRCSGRTHPSGGRGCLRGRQRCGEETTLNLDFLGLIPEWASLWSHEHTCLRWLLLTIPGNVCPVLPASMASSVQFRAT